MYFMNKDVIYIEAEDDITDILAKIKAAKNKIVALVPPKKASVLHSAVNFKLITKTAMRTEKTVVLISSDPSLLRLAAGANIPVAKTLQSKPKLPDADVATELGDNVDGDVIEAVEETPEKGKKIEVTDGKKPAAKKAAAKTAPAEKADMEIDEAAEEKKASRKKAATKIPNFKKNQKKIIAGAAAGLALLLFIIWASVFAPAVNIVVNIKTTGENFAEKVNFTSTEGNDDVDSGLFYVETKSVKKSVKGEFTATGQVDKGEKASGTVTVKVNSPVFFNSLDFRQTITVPSGTSFTHSGLKYVSTSQATITVDDDNIVNRGTNCSVDNRRIRCDLSADATATINVVASENGDKYNISATNSGWSSGASAVSVASSSAMTGGSSKIVKTVTDKDVAEAEASLDMSVEGEARDELSEEFGDDYLLITSSFKASEPRVTTSPALNEEVGDGVTPQIIKEIEYSISAVKREDVERFIKKVSDERIGDDTQMVHDTGIDKAFVDAFNDDGNGAFSGKLKSVVKIGPTITEAEVMEKSLGKKVGEVQTMIKSIKGVTSVEVKPSYFWVTKVPKNQNKVHIELKTDED